MKPPFFVCCLALTWPMLVFGNDTLLLQTKIAPLNPQNWEECQALRRSFEPAIRRIAQRRLTCEKSTKMWPKLINKAAKRFPPCGYRKSFVTYIHCQEPIHQKCLHEQQQRTQTELCNKRLKASKNLIDSAQKTNNSMSFYKAADLLKGNTIAYGIKAGDNLIGLKGKGSMSVKSLSVAQNLWEVGASGFKEPKSSYQSLLSGLHTYNKTTSKNNISRRLSSELTKMMTDWHTDFFLKRLNVMVKNIQKFEVEKTRHQNQRLKRFNRAETYFSDQSVSERSRLYEDEEQRKRFVQDQKRRKREYEERQRRDREFERQQQLEWEREERELARQRERNKEKGSSWWDVINTLGETYIENKYQQPTESAPKVPSHKCFDPLRTKSKSNAIKVLPCKDLRRIN